MKKLPMISVSVLATSLGFVVMAPTTAAEVAVSMSAVMNDGTTYSAGDAVNDATGVLSTPAAIDSLSVSAVVGTADAFAGGFTDTSSASSIAGSGLSSGTLDATGVTLTK